MKKLIVVALVALMLVSAVFANGEKEAAAAPAAGKEITKLDKDVTITVPFAVGSATDVRARLVAEYLQPKLGTTITIQNSAGAAGLVGITEMMTKKSNGYELSFCNMAVFTSIPLFNKTVYSLDDIIPLMSTDSEQFGMFACPAKSGIKSFDDVKNYKGKIKYATGAPGSIGHIMCATSMVGLGLDADHIVTNGASINLSECLGGSNDLAFAGLGLAKDYVKEGKLVPIYTFNTDDYNGYKEYGFDMPCLKTLGCDFSCESLMFFGARKDTPKEVVDFIQKCLAEVLADPEVVAKLQAAGALNMRVMGPEQILEWAENESKNMREYGPKIGLTIVSK